MAADFVAVVNQAYAAIPNYQVELPKYNDESEGRYNERVLKEMPGQFVLMDKKDIWYGGGQSQIEFCDLFSIDKDIIHVKRYGASSVLSHLFAQGRLQGNFFRWIETLERKSLKSCQIHLRSKMWGQNPKAKITR